MKAIVVYYSMSGNMKQVAESVASKLSADVLALHPVKAFPDKGAKKFLWGGRSAVMGSKPKLQPYIFNGKKYDTVAIWRRPCAPLSRTTKRRSRASALPALCALWAPAVSAR